jgi:hypothetical protein
LLRAHDALPVPTFQPGAIEGNECNPNMGSDAWGGHASTISKIRAWWRLKQIDHHRHFRRSQCGQHSRPSTGVAYASADHLNLNDGGYASVSKVRDAVSQLRQLHFD